MPITENVLAFFNKMRGVEINPDEIRVAFNAKLAEIDRGIEALTSEYEQSVQALESQKQSLNDSYAHNLNNFTVERDEVVSKLTELDEEVQG